MDWEGRCSRPISRSPFHGKQLRDFTLDVVALQQTPEFERWETRNDMLARWGPFCVALSTAAGATAQLADRKSLVKTSGSGAITP